MNNSNQAAAELSPLDAFIERNRRPGGPYDVADINRIYFDNIVKAKTARQIGLIPRGADVAVGTGGCDSSAMRDWVTVVWFDGNCKVETECKTDAVDLTEALVNARMYWLQFVDDLSLISEWRRRMGAEREFVSIMLPSDCDHASALQYADLMNSGYVKHSSETLGNGDLLITMRRASAASAEIAEGGAA